MRIWTLLLALVVGAFTSPAWAEEKKKEEKAVEEAKPDPKPAMRTVQVKSGMYQFTVRLTPGVPDPNEVEAAAIEMAEVPPVPDPIYGESIPVKDARLVAEVADADGAGYMVKYQVHPLTDAGAYGFHFTPVRKDTYRVVLRGMHKQRKIEASFRVPVGIWPFKDVDAAGKEKADAAGPATSRMPALPGSMSGPAVPAGADRSGPAAASVAKRSPIEEAMDRFGRHWVEIQQALLAGRKPDLAKAKVAAEALAKAARSATDARPGDSSFNGLIGELATAADQLAEAASKGKAKPAIEAHNLLGGRHCNRCHFASRWNILASPADFPGGLP